MNVDFRGMSRESRASIHWCISLFFVFFLLAPFSLLNHWIVMCAFVAKNLSLFSTTSSKLSIFCSLHCFLLCFFVHVMLFPLNFLFQFTFSFFSPFLIVFLFILVSAFQGLPTEYDDFAIYTIGLKVFTSVLYSVDQIPGLWLLTYKFISSKSAFQLKL